MKKFAFFAALAAVLLLVGCGLESGKKDSENKKVSIVATIYPQYDWLKNVLGTSSSVSGSK